MSCYSKASMVALFMCLAIVSKPAAQQTQQDQPKTDQTRVQVSFTLPCSKGSGILDFDFSEKPAGLETPSEAEKNRKPNIGTEQVTQLMQLFDNLDCELYVSGKINTVHLREINPKTYKLKADSILNNLNDDYPFPGQPNWAEPNSEFEKLATTIKLHVLAIEAQTLITYAPQRAEIELPWVVREIRRVLRKSIELNYTPPFIDKTKHNPMTTGLPCKRGSSSTSASRVGMATRQQPIDFNCY